MGCGSSTPQLTPEDVAADEEEKAKIAAQQRRRLSVNPAHVGDVLGEEKALTGDTVLMSEKEHTVSMTIGTMAKTATFIVAEKSKKGYVPYNRDKVNQDRPIVAYNLGPTDAESGKRTDDSESGVSLFGCMDGHGEFGHLVSGFVQKSLAQHIGNEPSLTSTPATAITDGTEKMCQQLQKQDINCTFSGTTAVFSLLHNNTLYTANIGDSRAVMGQLVEHPKTGKKQIQHKDLSEDQKPERKDECERIERAGGRINTLPGPPGEDLGPLRVWLKDVDVPGLAMTRSIGDSVAGAVGVTSVPEIREHKLAATDIFAIWASDGVWEFISSEEAVAMVWDSRDDYDLAATNLVAESVNRWRAEEEVVDDITVVIVQFNAPKLD